MNVDTPNCCSILFQRGVYPSEQFKGIKKYGLQAMVTTDPSLDKYLRTVTAQMQDWITSGDLQKMVMVIATVASSEVLERWTFNVETDKEVASGAKCGAIYVFLSHFSEKVCL